MTEEESITVKCELCDGKGWFPVVRTTTVDEPGDYHYVVETFRQTCSWCKGKGKIEVEDG